MIEEEYKTMKKVLLIANRGYSKKIIQKMKELGYEVNYFNDKPNDGFICKTMGRYRVKFYKKVLTNYYYEIIDKIKGEQYDYLLMIRGEYATEEALEKYNSYFKHTKKILYMWDSVANCKGIERKWKYFDKVYTFDRMDYMKYHGKIEFLPLFYLDEYRAKGMMENEIKYDFAFIGTAHGDRPKIMKSISQQCKKAGKTIFLFQYSPHWLVFFYNKIFNKDYRGIQKKDISFVTMPQEKVIDVYASAKCAIDVESITQTGLTMRTMELLGLRKKIYTTNKDIVNYDFYNENNISVFDRTKMDIDFSFLEKPYEEIPESIYNKYSLGYWLKVLMEDDRK